jgi:hypothetical protein
LKTAPAVFFHKFGQRDSFLRIWPITRLPTCKNWDSSESGFSSEELAWADLGDRREVNIVGHQQLQSGSNPTKLISVDD